MNKKTILVNTISAIISIAFMEVVLPLIGIEVHHWAVVGGTLIGVLIPHKKYTKKMKYKIKVEVMQDGSSRYYPMVKKHWWSCWKYILSCGDTLLIKPSRSYFIARDFAERIINNFKSNTIDHTYEILYKEEEQ